MRASAGEDPATGERIILVDSVVMEKPGNERSERAARRETETLRTTLLAEADPLRVARTKSRSHSVLDDRSEPGVRTKRVDELIGG